MAFKKGEGGRPKGSKNKTATLAGDRCRALIESEDYARYFKHRLEVGQLPPVLEALMWHYAYGKPKELHEISGPNGGPVPYTWLPPQL